MADIIGFFAALDALAVLFLVGSLAFLWALVRVLIDDLELGRRAPEQDAPDRPRSGDGQVAPPLGATEEPPEPRPTDSGRRRAA